MVIVCKYLGMLKSYEEECVNDVLLVVWYYIDCFDLEKNMFKNWVVVVVKYKVIDYQCKYIKMQYELFSEVGMGEMLEVYNI